MAIRRKAILYTRYLNYSAQFGTAGETVVRESLGDALKFGYTSININQLFGEVKKVGATALQGALDSGAWLSTIDPITALPRQTHAVLIEVKNRRLTLYPRHAEVHQLLHKAAVVRNANVQLPVIPLLVCRRAHDRLFWMAKDLGFHVAETRRQFLTLPPKTETRLLDEIRTELALHDLTLITPASRPRIEAVFQERLPKLGPATAERWALAGSTLTPYYAALRKETLKPWERNISLARLRTAAEIALDQAGVENPVLAWALEEDAEPDLLDSV
ncbi:hypothetical protein SAMN05421748_11979 [Paractinoplanes atraurantiacus]|uniref:Uncharacterized protein n=2 Tax=Paractinoplanes atraurantiacus TaxID=1036182 RepID=A0A285JE72_9ACTN|nr:hypothetical protein SAMN05421748_11979 [Actinoplanes atraurantiacus]